ncbi:MAG: hypothetical protein LBU06_03160 [Desulfovibrio sp.]|jgi:hypothetical protein|nr:hypothetical protein [Desulfovibrio sp.]
MSDTLILQDIFFGTAFAFLPEHPDATRRNCGSAAIRPRPAGLTHLKFYIIN